MNPEIEKLIDRWAHANNAAKAASKAKYEVEAEIAAWMRDNRSEQIESDGVTVTFKPEAVYDFGKLAGMAEVMSPEDFASILTNPKPPEIRVNVVEAKKWAKKGDPWKAIVEGATQQGIPVLKIGVAK